MRFLVFCVASWMLAGVLACSRPAEPAVAQMASSRAETSADAHLDPAPAEPFAVVELFTSEGCSSCPRADANLARMEGAYRARRVMPLSLHVGYWNYLGWRDPFTLEGATERQRRYATTLASGQMYTPQMVVNGVEQFVGSDVEASDAAIGRALDRPAEVEVTVSARADAEGLRVTSRLSQPRPHDRLVLALTRDRAESRVSQGENAGRTLAHVDVVVSLRASDLGPDRTVERLVPMPHSRVDRLTAMVQARRGAIVGATRISLENRNGG